MGKEKSPSFKNMAITGCQIMYSNSLWSQVKWLDIKLKWPISTPCSNHLPYLPATVEKACSKDSRLIDLVESCTWDIPNPSQSPIVLLLSKRLPAIHIGASWAQMGH